MTGLSAPELDTARRVADTVLYEGYVLFPYHASATKNRYRWQWGVVSPRTHRDAGGQEGPAITTQLLLRADPVAKVEVIVRFLQGRHRQVWDAEDGPVAQLEVGDELLTTWDEGVEHEVSTEGVPVAALLAGTQHVPIELPAGREVREVASSEDQPAPDGHPAADGHAPPVDQAVPGTMPAARVVHTTEAIRGHLSVDATALPGNVVRLTATVDNDTDWTGPDQPREEMLRRALLGVHLLVVVEDAVIASDIDPPAWARGAADDCHSEGTWPVLVGQDNRVALAAPIILSDHPEIAPESPGPTYDATEVDELLTLSVLGLTDDEKRAARATDPRAAEIIDRAAVLPPRLLEHLHGTIRSFSSVEDDVSAVGPPTPTVRPAAGSAPERFGVGSRRATVDDPRGNPRFAPTPVTGGGPTIDEDLFDTLGMDDEAIESVVVDDVQVRVGDGVRLAPRGRADAQDMFTAGRTATVQRIVRDVDDVVHLAVTIDDDPAAELHDWYGRFLYYRADEVQPLDVDARSHPPGSSPSHRQERT